MCCAMPRRCRTACCQDAPTARPLKCRPTPVPSCGQTFAGSLIGERLTATSQNSLRAPMAVSSCWAAQRNGISSTCPNRLANDACLCSRCGCTRTDLEPATRQQPRKGRGRVINVVAALGSGRRRLVELGVLRIAHRFSITGVWHGDEQCAATPEHALHFGQRLPRIRRVLEHVLHGDDLKRSGLERQLAERAHLHIETLLATEPDGRLVDLGPESWPVPVPGQLAACNPAHSPHRATARTWCD